MTKRNSPRERSTVVGYQLFALSTYDNDQKVSFGGQYHKCTITALTSLLAMLEILAS